MSGQEAKEKVSKKIASKIWSLRNKLILLQSQIERSGSEVEVMAD